jgi:hypothetical protein
MGFTIGGMMDADSCHLIHACAKILRQDHTGTQPILSKIFTVARQPAFQLARQGAAARVPAHFLHRSGGFCFNQTADAA